MSEYPLFIVGSPRSGTSILVSSLLGAGYFGYNEGNFLSLIRMVEQTVEKFFVAQGSTHPKVLTSHIDQAELIEKLAGVIGHMAESKQPRTPWFDKTGSMQMVEAMPMLRRLWPSSRFIFAKRRGIENVVSRLVKFPRHNFEYHCKAWAGTMAAWTDVRASHPDIPGIEVDQRDISDAPEAMAHLIGGFLHLDQGAQAKVSAIMTRQHPQETRPGSASRVMTLEETGWTSEQLDIFERECGAQMRAYGYTTGADYRSMPRAA